MKITKIETIALADRLYLRVYTDEDITGLGMCGYAGATGSLIKQHETYLVGKDPLEIERHWQVLYRYRFFRGGPIMMNALSAIDIALWDIAGKHYGVPVHRLLGGPVREKVRVYAHIYHYNPPEYLAEHAAMMVKEGITAVRWEPYAYDFQNMRFSRLVQTVVDQVEAVREAVGDDVDICLDFHGKNTLWDAVAMIRAVEKYRPFFIEDPILPENIDQMADIAARTHLPIATGERLYTIYDFMQLLSRKTVHMVRPDILYVGGFTGMKKIATMAEAYYVGVVPHQQPITSVHVDAAIYNFTLQENAIHPVIGTEEGLPLLTGLPEMDGGYILVPDTPGHGLVLNDDAVKEFPHLTRPKRRFPAPPSRTPPVGRLLYRDDGSFAEW